MIVLGIESTAHTFGISVVRDKKILSNIKSSYTTEKGGLIPNEVAEHHIEVCRQVLDESLEEAGVSLSDIDLVAFSISPGLGHALRIGASQARTLSLLHDKPLVGVNHCVAHLEVGELLTDSKDPVLLYCSGANTQVVAYESGKYRVFGETLDIGVGNFLDTFARDLGLGFPGGPKVEELAGKSSEDDYVELPYSIKGMDVAFSGLNTNLKNKINSGKYDKESLCYSVQETVFAMLVEVAERAMAHTEKEELLLGGGVACNKRLQEMAEVMCEERGGECFIPEDEFLVDNAAMIAWTGKIMYESGMRIDISEKIRPYERTDDVDVIWR